MTIPLLTLAFRKFTVATVACALPLGATSFAAEGTAHTKETPQAAAPKKGVYEGMPAADLQALIGKPEKIVPVSTKTGHAEVWIYKRLKRTNTDVITIGTKPVIARQQRGDDWVDVVVGHEDITKNKLTEVFEVASFLIVNDQYITCTNTEEKVESFQ